jgi:hypothetical protein
MIVKLKDPAILRGLFDLWGLLPGPGGKKWGSFGTGKVQGESGSLSGREFINGSLRARSRNRKMPR